VGHSVCNMREFVGHSRSSWYALSRREHYVTDLWAFFLTHDCREGKRSGLREGDCAWSRVNSSVFFTATLD